MERGCENCKYQHLSEEDFPCNQCLHCYTSEWQPMTNADHIRSMSDEELAEFLIYSEENYKLFTSDGKDFYTYEEALKHEIEWLKSPTTD